MEETVLKISGLTKYHDGKCVLDDIDLSIAQGSIYGLLGRNGTGKTTISRIIMGLENATRGEVLLFGKHPCELTRLDKAKIGYVAEGHNLIQNYKVKTLISLCRSLSLRWNQKLFNDIWDLFNFPLTKKVKELSTGMRAQVNLALTMAAEPELLILDDPTLGLDTVIRRQFLELSIDLIQKEGRTILFNSHILSDVERIADRIGILYSRKLIVDCPLDNLKKRVRKFRIIFSDTAPNNLCMSDIIQLKSQEREMILTVANWDEQKSLFIASFSPENIIEQPMSLEDIFIECTQINSNGFYSEVAGEEYADIN